MESISKPHLVDLLRVFDKRKWFVPRIRYASVRSKPELIKDIKKYFFTYERGPILHFKQCACVTRDLPQIAYDREERTYLFDGVPFDVPVESRKKVRFSISRSPVTMHFDCYHLLTSTDPLST